MSEIDVAVSAPVSENATPRQERAMLILKQDGAVQKVKDGVYTVMSQSGIGLYKVEDTGEWKCNCPDYVMRGGQCKHILATRYYLEVQRDTQDGIQSERVPLTYKQAWSSYNAAQMQEIELFDKLLGELVATVPEPQQVMGRPRLHLSDEMFCAIQKAYSQLSSRRAHSLFRKAEEKGELSHAPHFNQVSKTLLRSEITPILQKLVTLSALPLASIETDFAIDSSGFRCSNFGAYLGAKHGVKREHKWIKAHICTGVRTNIVTDVVITDGNANDCPHFEKLARGTAEGFDVAEISADMGYSSRLNHEVTVEIGAKPYIPFKKNATGLSKGSSTWRKAYFFFQLHKEEFEAHYHKRSNVESTFGAIKKKFGESVRSKNTTAQKNELLCKILAYNITVLIHEMFESGIHPDFINPPPLTLKSDFHTTLGAKPSDPQS